MGALSPALLLGQHGGGKGASTSDAVVGGSAGLG